HARGNRKPAHGEGQRAPWPLRPLGRAAALLPIAAQSRRRADGERGSGRTAVLRLEARGAGASGAGRRDDRVGAPDLHPAHRGSRTSPPGPPRGSPAQRARARRNVLSGRGQPASRGGREPTQSAITVIPSRLSSRIGSLRVSLPSATASGSEWVVTQS